MIIIKHNKERFTFVLNSLSFALKKSVMVCFGITQSQSFLSKVHYMEGIRDKEARNWVRSNESLLYMYQGFVIQREFIYNLLARIQGTGLLACNSRKFVIRGVCFSRIPV